MSPFFTAGLDQEGFSCSRRMKEEGGKEMERQEFQTADIA